MFVVENEIQVHPSEFLLFIPEVNIKFKYDVLNFILGN